ncbi:MAG TPA: hypothetical protein VGO11_27850 [Chthoniobacteraceae bacterium]|jgi:hypothetical protein|nr:hypothetical protein [Chthoniobacteraceae bacterium]
MTAHESTTTLRNAIIIAPAGTQPINITNSQHALLTLENVQISSAPGQKILNVVNSRIEARHITVMVPEWENAGAIHVTASVIGGTKVTNLAGGAWSGEQNVYAIAFDADARNTDCANEPFGHEILKTPRQPFPGAGATAAEFKIPPRPVPHPAAGKFTALATGVP